MAKVWLWVLPVLGLVIMISGLYVYAVVSTVIEQPAYGMYAKYVPSLFSGPNFIMHFLNETGQPVAVCVSVYGLMPNGSIGLVGFKCGRGSVGLDYSLIREYANSWRVSLKAMGNDPDVAEPGLILLGVVVYGDGIRTFIRGLPINTTLIARGYSVDVSISLNTTVLPMIPRSEIMKAISSGSASLSSYRPVIMQSWPPGEILSSCFTDPNTGVVACYVWKLDKVFYSATFTGVPTAMAYVTGNVYKVNGLLHEHLETKESLGIYVNFAAGAQVDVKSGSSLSTSYESDIYVYTLRKSYVYLEYVMYIYPTSPSIYAIGFIGNYTISRYKLYYCVYSIVPYCYYVNENATMAIAVPILRNNAMIRWNYNDTNPSDGYGLDPIFNVVARNWKPSNTVTSTSGASYYSYVMVREVNGIDLLSVAIPLLAKVPVSPYIAASVGLSSQPQYLSATDVSILLKDQGAGTIYANYYYTPVRYQWGSGSYYIPATYIYVSVS